MIRKIALGLFLCNAVLISQSQLINVASSANGGKATARDYGTYGSPRYPSNINDGSLKTNWAGMRMPAWCQIEFNQEYIIKSVRCIADYHTQSYRIELSRDGTNWKTITSHTTPDFKPSGESEGADIHELQINNYPARFVRIVITTTDAPRSHIFQAIIDELEVFGSLSEQNPRKSIKDVALARNGGKATARDYGTYGTPRYPSNINDGNPQTNWAGMRMPAWCQIEFNQEYIIKSVRCIANYHTQSYRIELSRDGTNWKTITSHTTPDFKPSGESEGKDIHEVRINNYPARFARVVITSTDAPHSHIFQAIIDDLEVFGY